MSSLKRKDAPGGPSAAKSARPASEGRPSKRPKADKASKADAKSEAKPTKASESKPVKAPIISRLKEEEPLFPRGGGSVLSPLEQKQIQVQAKADALFEEQSGANANKAGKVSKKKKGKSSTKGELRDNKTAHDEDSVKIESLNFKRLVKGSLVLCQVSEVHALDLVVTLPNNLTGHIPITAISQTLTDRIEAEAADSDDRTDESAEDDVELSKLFEIGQYLRAFVTSTIDDSATNSSKNKRRIELSLFPELANSGLSDQDIVENCTVMASVLSEEDHGFVMSLGFEGSELRAFLPKKEVDTTIGDDRLQPGSAVLCLVVKKNANGKVVQLSTKQSQLGSPKSVATEAPTIKSFLPGSVVDVLVSEVSRRGIVGKILGHLDVTADSTHSGAGPDGTDLEEKFKVGEKVKARIICNFPTASNPKLGVSLLDHILTLKQKTAKKMNKQPLAVMPISSIVEQCKVSKVEQDIGLWVDIGVDGVPGFVHISRVKDGKVDALYESSGPYKVDSVHRARVIGYNSFDGLYLLSFEKTVLEQPFLRISDIPVGQVVHGVIEKLMINDEGVSGLIVKLADGISGLVPEMHMADVRLQHPEKKFKEGMKVKARVLSTDPAKHQLRLTLKKTLVNSEASPLFSFDQVSVGLQTPGTIINVLHNGAVVQFYGSMRGFLPISEMSEAYIHDPKEHFRVGQVVSVRVLDAEPEANKLIVSCKDPSAFGMDKQLALKNLKIGDIVAAKVTQKTEDDIFLELEGSLLKATLSVGHLSGKSASKNQSALKKIHVGQVLSNLVVIDKNEGRRALVLSQKPSLVKAGETGELLATWDDSKVGAVVSGFVRNVTATAAFIQFGGNLTALLPKSLMPSKAQGEHDFGLHKFQSLEVKIVSVDNGRLVVSIPSEADKTPKPKTAKIVENPIDNSIKTLEDVTVGKTVKAKITAIKETQLNIALADNIQGRIAISEIFDEWDEIPSAKEPLSKFKVKQIIDVRVLGVHDAKTHTFLAISHRTTQSLIDCSIKPSTLRSKESPKPISLAQVEVDSKWLGFVNNHGPNCLWISLTPTLRGRLNALDVSDDLSQVKDLATNYPIGTAIRVRVTGVDAEHGRLDLSARAPGASETLTWDTIKQGMVLPGKVTKVNDRQVLVQLSQTVSGPIHLVDLADDYESATTLPYSKNDIIRVAVVELDKSNKKIRLSARPSRVLNSSLPVEDRELVKGSKLEAGDIVRGFVKNVADKGLFVNLGGDITGFVRVSDLSDRYLKEWKDHFQIDQLVKARVVSVDATVGHILLSLKASVIDENYTPPRTLESFTEGEIVTGKVRKAEEFGVFILLDNSANVSGLCHRSEMAEKPVKDARKLYKEGDKVKAKVLAVDPKKKRINLGLKPSYFDGEDSDMDVDSDEENAGAGLDSEDEDSEDEDMLDAGGAVLITGTDNDELLSDDESSDEDVDMVDSTTATGSGLEAGGFDWSGAALDEADDGQDVSADEDAGDKKKTKKRKAEIQVDRTANLDAQGPQTASDFERLLLGQPNSSELWTAYMAFQMKISELAKAREIAERALDTINPREETEKFNMWIAYLNLEVAYGTDETLDEVFKRACQYNDKQEVYERLAQSYIQSAKHSKADDLFQSMLKLFGSKTPKVWLDYAHFLHYDLEAPERARALLPRAMQRLEKHEHLTLMTEFASIEFQSPSGNPERGRTIFEGILDQWPKRADLWGRLLDLENSYFRAERAKGKDGEADPTVIRDLFERRTRAKGLKPRVAMKWYERWGKWEEEHGDAKSKEKVRAKAKEWVAEAEKRKAEREAEAEADDE